LILLRYSRQLMMPPRTQKVLDSLKAWCDQGRGRQSEVADVIGTTRQAINHWFAGRQQPTAEQILAVQEFLAKQRRRSKKP
jgi:transcriptional regulator with XRE-family HTH domain